MNITNIGALAMDVGDALILQVGHNTFSSIVFLVARCSRV